MASGNPLADFTIRMGRLSRWTCRVLVYSTKDAMWRAHRARGWSRYGNSFEAICEGYTRQTLMGKRWHCHDDICTLRFHLGSLKIGIITHEAVHAALRWYEAAYRKKTLRLSSQTHDVADAEENLAWVVGHIVIEIIAGTKHLARKHTRRTK